MRKAGKVGAYIASVSLLDRFLVIYLVLFLIHIIYALFSGKAVSTQMNSIDVVLRTFASAVFGYFLSGNFAKTEDYLLSKAYGKQLPTTYKSSDKTANRAVRIGFSDLSQENGEDVQVGVALPAKVNFGSSLQIHIVAVVGLVCLIILIVVRNVEPAGENIAALTQLRDMLSSSVGFLVGSKRSS